MLRPRATRWFEILAARDDATLVLEALARTGAVELEAGSGAPLPADPAEMTPLLGAFSDLSARYRAYWPEPRLCRPSAFPEAPVPTLQRCLAAIRAWALEAEPVIRALQRDEAERAELQVWLRALDTLGASGIDPRHLAGAGPLVAVRLSCCPPAPSPHACCRRPRRAWNC